jgi:hypothetical protein
MEGTPYSRAILAKFGFFWAQTASQALTMQDSSNLEDLGILGGGNSFKRIILMKSTVTVQSTVTVRRTLTASAVRVAYGTDIHQ